MTYTVLALVVAFAFICWLVGPSHLMVMGMEIIVVTAVATPIIFIGILLIGGANIQSLSTVVKGSVEIALTIGVVWTFPDWVNLYVPKALRNIPPPFPDYAAKHKNDPPR
jgi:hypothetical protein